MPIEHAREPDLIRIIAAGTYSMADVVAGFEAALAELPGRRPLLVDARSSEASPP